MLSHFLAQGLLTLVVLVGGASATTIITVNGIASHSIPPLLCTPYYSFFFLPSHSRSWLDGQMFEAWLFHPGGTLI